MAKRYVTFTFSQDAIQEPIIYNLSQQFNVVTNILRADISIEQGWAVLELEGKDNDIEQGIAWVTSKGVRVDPITGNNAEGLV
ncbi:NIL domain-containing protein [Chloroflexota bacterium]